ncbi:hypothetical protein BGZ97_009540, partial [Linnemannia gamsii]
LDRNNSSQPFSNRDNINRTNKTNSGNIITLKTAPPTSTRQKTDVQDLPSRIRANIKNIEALAEWMGDVAVSVESLEVQAGEQQQRGDRVPGEEQSELQSEGAWASDSSNPNMINNIFDVRQLPQQKCKQHDSKDESASEEREMTGDVGTGQDLPVTGDVVKQSSQSCLESEKSSAHHDEISVGNTGASRQPEAEMVDYRVAEAIALGDDGVDDNPDHNSRNKDQADEHALDDEMEDDVGEIQQSVSVESVGGTLRRRNQGTFRSTTDTRHNAKDA